MSNQSLVPHPCARVVLEPLAAAGLGGSGHGWRGGMPATAVAGPSEAGSAKASACVLLPVLLHEQVNARHVSRKNPQNHRSNWELRPAPGVCCSFNAGGVLHGLPQALLGTG